MGWRFSVLSGLATLLMGVPLSAIISPLVYALVVLVIDLVNLATPIADPFKTYTGRSAASPVTPQEIGVIALALLLPGALVLLLSWLGLRRVLRHGATGAPVLALGARDPRTGDLDEHQLANLVAEMAVAGGIPPPAFKLLDSPVANAGVLGSSLEDATIVVTTGLLGVLDRNETLAVIGQLVGSAGNGDLRIGVTLLSLFSSLGAVGSFLGAPADRSSRKVAWRVLRFAFGRRRKRDAAAEASLMSELLSDQQAFDVPERSGAKAGLLSILTLPFLMASGAFMMNRLLFGPLLVNPFLKRRWRARRYLADASAVELTRDPTALARALRKLDGPGGMPPGTEWATHLFIVGGEPKPGTELGGLHPTADARIGRLIRMGAEVEPPKPSPRKTAAFWVLVVLTSPIWLGILFMLYGIGLALTMISFAIDGLFLAPVVGALHALLRSAAR